MVPDRFVTVTLLPLAAPDSAAARALADTALGDAPYAEPLLASLDGALTAASDEYRAIVAHDEGALVGLVVFGETAGARGAGRIYVVVVDAAARRRGIATALLEAACHDLGARGARFVAIELPEDPHVERGRWLADRGGFREEARVSDYVREGVGLVFLRRDLVDCV
jgi:ribosomal protein S18 acetylase RimI-like enzyme